MFFIRGGLIGLKVASLIEILCVKFVICGLLPIAMEIKPSKIVGVTLLYLN